MFRVMSEDDKIHHVSNQHQFVKPFPDYSGTQILRFYDMARGQENHIVKSGYRYKQTPDLEARGWKRNNE